MIIKDAECVFENACYSSTGHHHWELKEKVTKYVRDSFFEKKENDIIVIYEIYFVNIF